MSDEYEGQGGSYVLDKKTGKRKLVERTGAPPPPPPATEESPPPVDD